MASDGEEQVDGGVRDGKQRAKRGGESFKALHRLLVVEQPRLQQGEPAGLAVADDLLHLGFEDGEVGEDLGFKVGHFFVTPLVACKDKYGEMTIKVGQADSTKSLVVCVPHLRSGLQPPDFRGAGYLGLRPRLVYGTRKQIRRF